MHVHTILKINSSIMHKREKTGVISPANKNYQTQSMSLRHAIMSHFTTMKLSCHGHGPFFLCLKCILVESIYQNHNLAPKYLIALIFTLLLLTHFISK